MRIETTGIARIRHKDTGEIYEIEPEDLEWDAVGGSERQMGPETEYAAEFHHSKLGELVWRLWEYPIGAENYQQEDLNGHELIENFDIGLVHEPDGEDYEREEEEDLSPRAAVQEMREWFARRYEDPAQSLPYNSREGGFQWIRGGPYSALQALEERFGTDYPFGLLEEVARDIVDDAGGLDEWSPIDDPDFDGDDAFAPPTAEERSTAAARVRDSVLELEAIIAPLIDIERETGGADLDSAPGIGHNRPPGPIEDAGLPPGFFHSLGIGAERISEAVARTEDLLVKVVTAADLGAAREDSNIVLARAMADHAEALRDNMMVVRENSKRLREISQRLYSLKKVGVVAAAGAALGGVFDGALGRIGEILVDKGVALLKPLGPSALAYFDLVAAKISQVAEAAAHYIGTLSIPF